MIFLFRSFIFDIYHQLELYQSKHSLKVYRSQLMSTDELKSLKERIGQFISINSFFSTSTDYDQALLFLRGSDDLERILFEIHADPKMITTKPFADISKHSEFTGEAEILFMLGSIFRLQSIKRNDKDDIWIIRMIFCNDDEHDLKKVLMSMKQEMGNEETNLQTLGKILSEMGKFELAERYFIRLLNELPPNDSLRVSLYKDLAKVAAHRGDFDMSIQWRQKSLELEEQNQLSVNPVITKTNKPAGKFINFKRILSRKLNILLWEKVYRQTYKDETQ
jgi:tetratricopeptide (TPR) repeat protein